MELFQGETVREFVAFRRCRLETAVAEFHFLEESNSGQWSALIQAHQITALSINWDARKTASLPDLHTTQVMQIIPFTGTRELLDCYCTSPCRPLEAEVQIGSRHLSLAYTGDKTHSKQAFEFDRVVIDMMVEQINRALRALSFDALSVATATLQSLENDTGVGSS